MSADYFYLTDDVDRPVEPAPAPRTVDNKVSVYTSAGFIDGMKKSIGQRMDKHDRAVLACLYRPIYGNIEGIVLTLKYAYAISKGQYAKYPFLHQMRK